ncbi:hypothetical protein KR093_007538, partial [Drosophila rubida]
FRIELHNLTCVILSPAAVHQLDCIVYEKRIIPTLSVMFQLAKLVDEFTLLYKLQLVKKDNSKMTIANLKLDGCKFIASLYTNNMLAKWFKRVKSVSNLPKKCPIPGNKLFEIRNYTVLAEEYPPHVPAMAHEFRMNIEYKNMIVADIIVKGKIAY